MFCFYNQKTKVFCVCLHVCWTVLWIHSVEFTILWGKTSLFPSSGILLGNMVDQVDGPVKRWIPLMEEIVPGIPATTALPEFFLNERLVSFINYFSCSEYPSFVLEIDLWFTKLRIKDQEHALIYFLTDNSYLIRNLGSSLLNTYECQKYTKIIRKSKKCY